MLPPASRPCGSCPYRCDVPSGVWSREEYEKLPPFDGETWDQPPSVFLCHQQDGRLCAGWVAVHDMGESLGVRMALVGGALSQETAESLLVYETDVELFASGAEAAAHGLADVEEPGEAASRTITKLEKRRTR